MKTTFDLNFDVYYKFIYQRFTQPGCKDIIGLENLFKGTI